MLASCPAHKVNQITAEPHKNESASRHPALMRKIRPALTPHSVWVQVMRTEIERPKSSMRFSA